MSAFQLPSLTDLINQINAANGTSFAAANLSFSDPKVVSGTWQGLSSDRNSAIRATGVGPTYQGNVVVLYDRLDLGQLANLPGIQNLAVNNPSTTYDILPDLYYYTGIQFTEADLQDLPITLTDGAGQVQLSADPNSIGWQGSVMLNVVAGGTPIDVALAVPQMAGLNYPVADASAPPATAIYGPVYLYPYDFTSWQSEFLTYTAGVINSTQASEILSAIQTVDVGTGKSLWVADSNNATSWELTGATIVSNGLNNPSELPTNPNFKYVMVLQLAAQVTTPAGLLYLHYNDPFNPDDF